MTRRADKPRTRAGFLALSVVVLSPLSLAQTAILRPEVNPPEDPKLRADAVALLERAVQVSTPATWTNVEIDIHFHVGSPEPGEPSEGDYSLNVGNWWKLRRHEWHYGTYSLVLVRNGDRFNQLISEGTKPAFTNMITDTSPIDLVRFNHEDVIRSIADGPNGSACIQFDVVFGDRMQNGEICVDKQNWLDSFQTPGDLTTVHSEFFHYQNVFLPAHVERSVGNVQQFVFEQTVRERTDFPSDFFAVPENSTIHGIEACKEFRRGHPFYAPQPEPIGSSQTVTDIQLAGIVGADGHVFNLKPMDYLYPELNKQAVEIVSTWTYTPASCDGKVTGWSTTFVVQFRGR